MNIIWNQCLSLVYILLFPSFSSPSLLWFFPSSDAEPPPPPPSKVIKFSPRASLHLSHRLSLSPHLSLLQIKSLNVRHFIFGNYSIISFVWKNESSLLSYHEFWSESLSWWVFFIEEDVRCINLHDNNDGKIRKKFFLTMLRHMTTRWEMGGEG